ncbi:hypothetical protein DITRI_Ditri09bG0033300 [Diplodiscus trichospermus]
MAEKVNEKNGVFIPPNSSDFSYVLSITLRQPTIRIRIPKALVKAMQRRNQARGENDEYGSKNKKKKGFRKKVGSMVSNVFGNKRSPETDCSKGEKNGEVHGNGDDEEMKKVKNTVERVDTESEKTTRETSEDNDGGEQMALAAGDEGKEKPKSRRTRSKTLDAKRNDLKLNKGKINNVDDSNIVGNTDLSVACVGENGSKTFGTKGIVSLKQAENSNDFPRFQPKTVNSQRKLKTAWSMKKMKRMLIGGKSEKHELCKKRILMGGKCRPLNHSGIIQYDENGVLMPEIIP